MRCEKNGRHRIWTDNENETQTKEGSGLISVEDTGLSENASGNKNKSVQDGITKGCHPQESLLGEDTDSSPLSSINMSLLEEAEGRDLDQEIALENDIDRKRKAEKSQHSSPVPQNKRVRHDSAAADDLNEVLTSVEGVRTSISTGLTTQESMLTHPMPHVHEMTTATDSLIKQGPLDRIATEIASDSILPSEPITPDKSLIPAIPSASDPSPPHLTSEHIMLARIPGSESLKTSTIAKASEWFGKLLTDGNGIDMIEIKRSLGIRIYREEELPAYQRLRNAVAQEQARVKAQELADVLDASAKKGAAAIGMSVDNKFDVFAGNYSDKMTNAPEQPEAPSQGVAQNMHISATGIDHTSNARPYSLRLKLKGGYHGNQFYASDGRPKTEQARRNLEARDAAGDADVIRVYE